jgi:excisionase family DNA binding protein
MQVNDLAPAAVRRTYTITEAAEILGISRTTAYECAKDGELPVLRLRGRLVVPAAALDALLQAL